MTAITPTKSYIENKEGCYRILGKRISLDSVIYAFLNGNSPESIAQSFPALTLEEIYGAITFYLANRETIDTYLKEGEQLFIQRQQKAKIENPLLYQNSIA